MLYVRTRVLYTGVYTTNMLYLYISFLANVSVCEHEDGVSNVPNGLLTLLRMLDGAVPR